VKDTFCNKTKISFNDEKGKLFFFSLTHIFLSFFCLTSLK